jgi:AbrB family looped-hinge helix DNA binding protein
VGGVFMFNYVTTLVLDKMGRIVIPSKVRESMGLEKGCALVLNYDGTKIIIEKVETKNENEN